MVSESRTLPQVGRRVRVKEEIHTSVYCEAFFVHPRFIQARKAGASGTYRGWVAGCGGDVWWVEHDDTTQAAYLASELDFEIDAV